MLESLAIGDLTYRVLTSWYKSSFSRHGQSSQLRTFQDQEMRNFSICEIDALFLIQKLNIDGLAFFIDEQNMRYT